ncbi:hypothetical protein [Acidovorax sp. SUPP2825]|nr:hypothetical protein [Acidovorax sp. SUPP2825]GKS96411.1 hypothetical protein AVAK2825_17770 [Acidovorax sp. SUPP2825]
MHLIALLRPLRLVYEQAKWSAFLEVDAHPQAFPMAGLGMLPG